MPWLSGMFALIAAAYAAWTVAKTLPHVRNLRLAIEGERAVGQGLEQLRAQGYAVYHDIPGDGFNVDHLLVGPAGVFTIETKTRSKPLRGNPTVLVDGESLLIDGRSPTRDSFAQSRAQAKWISDALKTGTGRDFPVFPVIVFPGWWVETKSRPSSLWIVNDKALPKFLARENQRLTLEEISTAKSQLEMFIRARMRLADATG